MYFLKILTILHFHNFYFWGPISLSTAASLFSKLILFKSISGVIHRLYFQKRFLMQFGDARARKWWESESDVESGGKHSAPLLNSLFTKGKICTRFLFLNISEWYTDPISKQSFLMQFGDARTRKWKWCGIRRETFRPLLASHFLCPNNRSGQLQQFLPAQPENPVFPNNFYTSFRLKTYL